ncbi:MAG TPA: hypothetical protein VHC49_12520, partial [Mycobacteriales bacterium]|nr:hypothetical protein [Mycobacteriales bacterium]
MTGQLPRWADTNSAERFDRRFADRNVEFWQPRLVRLGRIESGHRVVDAGCGTGGFAAAIAESTG